MVYLHVCSHDSHALNVPLSVIMLKLFDSWEPDAVVMDHTTRTCADHTKVHPIHFEDEFFKVRGR
jgi:long-chain alkane monooxygenase